MELARDSVLQPSHAAGGRWSLATISLVALVALGFFVSVALPYLLLDPSVLARYEPRRAWVVAHVAAGGVALLTGPISCGSASAASPCAYIAAWVVRT